ncbi:hypothetical protein EX290_10665 [Enterococcus faecium]|uniref:hypothetical protein n=1 Tax=Enterococcus faecium TaxID=1352 RepID=UPI00136912C8|nr:hypothetical protein [Enterococcus faecium]NAL98914.1 hypothetical protein [Enterococcus faecium]NAM12482.1 hypothetical protein [Enterococcus faecium]NAM27884.1 hypothetical protein [Enterococcus faecium]NAM35737.1 hypothetical protein [Enterococcus faecium]NAM43935.1 hypothetical protein [Enterococcus faecium]
MKFFEVKSPYYYALIAAKKEECAELYEQVVTDIENREEFIRCLHELNRNEAIQEDAKKISEETLQPIGMEEATKDIFTIIDEQKSCVLSIDSTLV